MSGSQLALLGGPFGPPPAYQIQRSLRFNSADSADLSRTPASASNRKTFTVSVWLKRSSLASRQGILTVPVTGSLYWGLEFDSSNSIIIYDSNAGGGTDITTSAVYRDLSAWYHIVVAVDTTQATASNRVKLYVNGTQVTAFSSANYPTQNSDTYINSTSTHRIGSWVSVSTLYFNGYMTEFYLIDGQALTPSSFGQTNASTGVWEPIAYTGTYGTNGFYLNFSDNSNNTSTTLGKDYSGNGNNWTPNNFSVTAGAENDSLVDTPTPYGTDTGAGGEVRGNYCTLNSIDRNGSATVSNGSLEANSTGTNIGVRSTFGLTSGKWYFEGSLSTSGVAPIFGVADSGWDLTYVGSTAGSCGYGANGVIYGGTGGTGTPSTYTTGDIIGVAFDVDAQTVSFYKNGVAQKTGISLTVSIMFPATSMQNNTNIVNFGQRPFAYTAPSGFKALVTQNLPTPATVQPDDYFNTVLWTGNGASSRAITGVGFQPDWVWDKMRSDAYQHAIVDSVRGGNKVLHSNSTAAEDVNWTYGYVSSFDSDGFTIQAGSTSAENWNLNAATFVAWCWKANGTGSSNTQGTITSTVSANTTSGFSIVTYTGTGSAGTIGHGLSVAPVFIITKKRNSTSNWATNDPSQSNPWSGALLLNTTDSFTTSSAVWNNTAPTSSVFSVGTADATNVNSATYVAYCFAPVAGFSAFGSYTGNGSSNGPFVYTGFRPKWILIRPSDSVDNWQIQDTARSPYNVVNDQLWPNLSDAEQVDSITRLTDFLSNGFKLRGSNPGVNGNAVKYIYAAFAENPFKYALAR